MTLTAAERERFEAWAADDPPDDWERTRNERIAAIQGVGNPALVVECRPDCCMVCAASQACGDACISASRTCRKTEPGCACEPEDVCAE